MKRVYTTANGQRVNIDAIIAQNEETIAVGNMKVNARGDQLGPGGVVEVSKSKMMADYYKLNSPVAVDREIEPRQRGVKKDLVEDWVETVVAADTTEQETPETNPEPQQPVQPRLRGNLADAVAKNKPAEKEVPKKSGPQRI